MKALVEEASTLRESLLVAADALAHFGLLDAARVAEIRVGQGYLDTADDLVALAALFTLAWPAVSGKTAIEKAQVDRAAMLGPELLTALGAREHSGAVAEKSAESRARAFTLFVRAYDACRQALTYVRWEEGDANSIAPSLFRLRKARKGKKGEVTEEKTPEEVSPPQEE